jgi:hypothetical protein
MGMVSNRPYDHQSQHHERILQSIDSVAMKTSIMLKHHVWYVLDAKFLYCVLPQSELFGLSHGKFVFVSIDSVAGTTRSIHIRV